MKVQPQQSGLPPHSQNVTEPEWKKKVLTSDTLQCTGEKIVQPTCNISTQQRKAISLKFLSKGTLIYHLLIFEIPTKQTCSGQSPSSKQVSWAQLAASCGHAGQAVRTSPHETSWQVCNSLQAQEAKALVSVKKEWANYHFPLYFMQFLA